MTVESRPKDVVAIQPEFERLLPRDQLWTEESVFIAKMSPDPMTLHGRMFGENFDPQPFDLEVVGVPTTRPMTQQDLKRAQRELGEDEDS